MKITAYFMAIIMLFSLFTSCSSGESSSNQSGVTEQESLSSKPNEENQTSRSFSLAYFSSDSLNPYSAKQMANFNLGTLLYDSLYTVDSNFNAVPIIAQSVVFEDNSCIVEIKNNAVFSDGSKITARDVVQSFERAKNCPYYSGRLSNVISCSDKKGKAVFKLNFIDKSILSNLSFPIIKNGSKDSHAVGSGRFKINSSEKQIYLEANANSLRKGTTDIKKIFLQDIKEYSNLANLIKIGNVSYSYSAPGNDLAAAYAKTSYVMTNNLVYLGMNSTNIHLSNPDFRKSISLVINRNGILSDIYAGMGNAVSLPFNPQAKGLQSNSYKIDLTNTSSANELFTICGYTQKNENGLFVSNEAEVRIRLLVNSSNAQRVRAAQMIKLNLEAIGVGVDIIEETDENYRLKIQQNDYDLFIGEIKLAPNNDISALLKVGSLNACDDMSETYNSYLQYLSGQVTLEDFLRKFDLKTPFIPILYRSGIAVYSSSLGGNDTTTEYDLFAKLENWEF